MSIWTVLQFVFIVLGLVIAASAWPSPLGVAIGSFSAGQALAYFIVQLDLRKYSLVRNSNL